MKRMLRFAAEHGYDRMAWTTGAVQAERYGINNHYNGTFVEPYGERSQRGYDIEVLERFVREVGFVELGGAKASRADRVQRMRTYHYNDVSADRQVVAAVQAMEAILAEHVAGNPDCVVKVNDEAGGLALYRPGFSEPEVLYSPTV